MEVAVYSAKKEVLPDRIVDDDVFSRLLTFPHVLITGHQGFFAEDALASIAKTTADNFTVFENTGAPTYEISTECFAGTAKTV